jgi:hypothetical protein
LLVFVGPCFQKGDIHNVMGLMLNRVILLVSECKASKCSVVPWPTHCVHVIFFFVCSIELYLNWKFSGKFRDEKLRSGHKVLVKGPSAWYLEQLAVHLDFFCLHDRLN